jgi:hypothetical protein
MDDPGQTHPWVVPLGSTAQLSNHYVKVLTVGSILWYQSHHAL